MFISIVIPTYNRAHLLESSCAALMNQETDDDLSYEVIFVDNGSSDSTPQVLARLASDYGESVLRYFRLRPTGGPAAPRNRGIAEARGDIIVILDDDVVADPDLLQAYAEYHRKYPQKEAAAVGVAYVPDFMIDKPVSLFHTFNYGEMEPDAIVSYVYFWTCNLSIKREFMLESGMFDERFLYNEDIICGHSLDQAGMKLRFWPRARGQHLHQLRLEDIEEKGKMVGRWIWATSRALPYAEVLDRYGVLSPRLGPWRFCRRVLKRSAFRMLDNPLTFMALSALGARNGERSRWSDLYYYLIYRRSIVSGFGEAKRKYRRAEPSEPAAFVQSMN